MASIRHGLLAALDHFSIAVILAGVDGRLTAWNLAAEALLDAPGSPLRRENGMLWSAGDALGPALSTLQDVAILHLPRADGAGALVLLARKASALVLLSVSTPDAVRRCDPGCDGTALMRLFGLSPGEADVVLRLAAGATAAEIAAARKVSRETVRVQLKSAFAKTGARTQVQLALLAERSLATLRRPFPAPDFTGGARIAPE